MAKFEVTIYEVWARTLVVDAEEDTAKETALAELDAGNQDGNFEYSHLKDSSSWYVNKIEE